MKTNKSGVVVSLSNDLKYIWKRLAVNDSIPFLSSFLQETSGIALDLIDLSLPYFSAAAAMMFLRYASSPSSSARSNRRIFEEEETPPEETT